MAPPHPPPPPLSQFWAVSDPFGADYKNYLSLEQIADMLHPVKEGEVPANEAIMAFLAAQPGLVVAHEGLSTTLTRDLVNAKLNAKAAEEFFGTELYHYGPATVGSKKLDFIRAGAPYSLPEEIASKISLVDKLLQMPHLTPLKIDEMAAQAEAAATDDDVFNSGCSGAGITCHGSTNPSVLREVYGFTPLDSFHANNSMACTEFQLQGIDNNDLNNFASACDVDHVQVGARSTACSDDFPARTVANRAPSFVCTGRVWGFAP